MLPSTQLPIKEIHSPAIISRLKALVVPDAPKTPQEAES
jgi:hypothetical protein